MGLDRALSAPFRGFCDAEGEVGGGDDFDEVHEVERTLICDLGCSIEGIMLMSDCAGELWAKRQGMDRVCEGVILRRAKILVEVMNVHLCG